MAWQCALQITGFQAAVLGQPGQHPGTNLFAVMKGENHVRPPWAAQGFV